MPLEDPQETVFRSGTILDEFGIESGLQTHLSAGGASSAFGRPTGFLERFGVRASPDMLDLAERRLREVNDSGKSTPLEDQLLKYLLG